MKERASAKNVSAPNPIYGNVNDGVEHESVSVIRCAGRLSRLKCRTAQWQVIELKVEAQAKIAACVARDAEGSNAAATANKMLRVAIGETSAAAHVEGPLIECLRLFPADGNRFFGRSFLTAGLASLLLRLLLGLGR